MKIITTLLERVEFRSARLDDRFGNKLRKRSRREYATRTRTISKINIRI